MDDFSVPREFQQPKLSSSSASMYAKLLFKRNNAGGPSHWASDSRRRSLVLSPLPLSYEERMSKRRFQTTQLLRLQTRISTGKLVSGDFVAWFIEKNSTV